MIMLSGYCDSDLRFVDSDKIEKKPSDNFAGKRCCVCGVFLPHEKWQVTKDGKPKRSTRAYCYFCG